MDLKQTKHWRTQPNVEHRFTYNGFLTCSSCGEIIHTALARRDYYACKGRRSGHTCTTKYMGRERLEAILNELFSDRLTSTEFLQNCIEELQRRGTQDDSAVRIQRLSAEVTTLSEKRGRVVEAFLDAAIDREERDSRLAAVDRDIRSTQDLLTRINPAQTVDLASLVQAFSPLVEWEFWSRDQKRSVLASISPDIRVADYEIEGLGLNPAIFSNESTHSHVVFSTIGPTNAIAPSP